MPLWISSGCNPSSLVDTKPKLMAKEQLGDANDWRCQQQTLVMPRLWLASAGALRLVLRVSERVSSFLTAHLHNVGYTVPCWKHSGSLIIYNTLTLFQLVRSTYLWAHDETQDRIMHESGITDHRLVHFFRDKCDITRSWLAKLPLHCITLQKIDTV